MIFIATYTPTVMHAVIWFGSSASVHLNDTNEIEKRNERRRGAHDFQVSPLQGWQVLPTPGFNRG